MNNEIKKKVKIEVDASQLNEKYLKALDRAKKVEEDINKLYKSNERVLENKRQALDKLVEKHKLDQAVADKIYKLEEKRLKIARQLERQEKKSFEARRKLAQEQFEREEQRKEWSQGQETFYQKYQKYRGISGATKFLSDQIEKGGSAKELDIDKQIADLEFQKTKKGITNEEKADLDKQIEGLKDEKAQIQGNTKTAINKIKTAGEIIGRAAKLVAIPFKELAKGAIEVVKSFMSLKDGIATFNTANTLISNQSAREQQLKYGLSSSQNFAFTQAKSMLNIQSDEDLMYMNSKQRAKFLEYMEKYSKWYSKMEASGVLDNVQEMQLEFQELKQELGMEFLSWIAENKDTIMTAIKGIFNVIKGIADLVMAVVRLMPGGSSAISGTANSYSTSNRTVTINATTTNNNSGMTQTQVDVNSEKQWSSLAKQIITSIGG